MGGRTSTFSRKAENEWAGFLLTLLERASTLAGGQVFLKYILNSGGWLMKRFSMFISLAVLVFLCGVISCGGGTGLRSSVQKGYGPFSAKIPYLNNVNYFGYVGPGVAPDGKHNGKDAFYLYFWVPAVIDEVGVAMVSPADGIPPGKRRLQAPQIR
jgi:hypothetical protein